jgi:uncharacterized membrane protein
MNSKITEFMNRPGVANFLIFGFIAAALAVFVTQYPYDNIWTMITGILLWLLGVSIAKIEELCKKK